MCYRRLGEKSKMSIEQQGRAAFPELKSNTVFLIGNGVLRVPCSIEDGTTAVQSALPGPSWSEYMDTLWNLVRARSKAEPLSRGDFSQLSAPRQAEWFDREFPVIPGMNLAVLRLHILGDTLHKKAGVLTNPLLKMLTQGVIHNAIEKGPARGGIEILTTNIDCSIEQNLAFAAESLRKEVGDLHSSVEIEVLVNFSVTARWIRSGLASNPRSKAPLKIRLWKLHGCLRDLKTRFSDERKNILEIAPPQSGEFCGVLPADDSMAPNLGDWSNRAGNLSASLDQTKFSGIFSQSEYFTNFETLSHLAAEFRQQENSGLPEQVQLFGEFKHILEDHPLFLFGYSLLDEDVDIVYALQRYRSNDDAIQRWRLAERREESPSRKERLRQMGIEWTAFEVRPVGFCREPSRLDLVKRHEWRTQDALAESGSAEHEAQGKKNWRLSLQQVVAEAWLDPQLSFLKKLFPHVDERLKLTAASQSRHRLVVAGLGSIWHSFALTRPGDFPTRRRVSSRLVSVDTQVPGGSGLVPVMIAACIAGPEAVGYMAFVCNVPKEWVGWREIEEFCLSAGIDVLPWQSEQGRSEPYVGRTTHVIFFDPDKGDEEAFLPRQRYNIDVQSFTDERNAMQMHVKEIKVPPVRLPLSFQYQTQGGDDLLFRDKEVEENVVRRVKGHTVYETGASGDELATRLASAGIRPTIWTAGVGSFLRTIVAFEGRTPHQKGGKPLLLPEEVLEYLKQSDLIARLTNCPPRVQQMFVAKVVSFEKKGIWDYEEIEGFGHKDELDYGYWLRDHWFELGFATLDVVQKVALATAYQGIGGGILTTVHEGGLMAAWHYADGPREAIVAEITENYGGKDVVELDIECRVKRGDSRPVQDGAAKLVIGRNGLGIHAYLTVEDVSVNLGPSNRLRRNTLGAGDTVRGGLAYGLWAIAWRPAGVLIPPTVARIMFASCVLAAVKCYAGSFVDCLRTIESLRNNHEVWEALLGSRKYGEPTTQEQKPATLTTAKGPS